MDENWISINGMDGYYEVSDMGNVRSLDRVVTSNRGFERRLKGRVLKPQKQWNDYLFITLCINSKPVQKMVHRLVMESFYGYMNLDVNHKDLDKSNNRKTNLEYCTHRENVEHFFNLKKSTSRQVGVCFCKDMNQWEVRVMIDNVNYYLGRYDEESKAIDIRNEYLHKLLSAEVDKRHQIRSELVNIKNKRI